MIDCRPQAGAQRKQKRETMWMHATKCHYFRSTAADRLSATEILLGHLELSRNKQDPVSQQD